MLRYTAITALMLLLAAPAVMAQHNCGHCPAATACPSAATADTSKPAEPAFQKLPGAGKKIWVSEDIYVTYKFDKTPKIGVVVLKVQAFNKRGVKNKELEITGISDMPSMRGSHHTESQFKLNRLGDYLLPINLVMRGEWEVRLIFKKDGKETYRGFFTFKV